MRTIGNSPVDGEVRAVASGVLPDGKPVVVNADGTVSLISLVPEGFGSDVIINNYATMTGATFDSNSNRVVVVYREGSNGYGTAIVGTVSDRTISFGTAVTYESAISNYNAITFDSNSNKVVIAYQDDGNSGYTTSIVGTVDPSDNSITFGTAVIARSVGANWVSATFDSNSNKVVVAVDQYAFVGTVNGTSISFGSAVDYGSGTATLNVASTFDTNSNKVVLCYTKGGFCKSRVGTVSGTGISFGTEASVVPFPASGSENGITFDSNSNKVVAVTLSTNGLTKAAVGTVSGTGISYGTAANVSSETYGEMNRVVFDSSTNKIIAFWKDGGNSYNGTSAVGTVSGTEISFESPVVFNSGSTGDIFATFDSNSNKAVVVYQGNSKFRASVFGFVSTTLTAENFVGITNGAVDYVNREVGSKAVFENTGITQLSSGFDSNSNRVVFVYGDDVNNNYGTAVVGNVSGTSISFGTPVVFEAGEVINPSVVFDSSNNKVVIVYADAQATMYGHAIVGTVDPSNNSISFGTAAVFESNSVGSFSPGATFDSNSNKVVIVYSNGGNSLYGTAKVATISGTSISFGTAAVFSSNTSDFVDATFDSNSNKTVIIFRDGSNSNYGTAVVGTVSGTSISFGSLSVFNAGSTTFNACTFDSDLNKVLVAFRDAGNSNKGTAVIGTVSETSISFGSEVVFNDAVTKRISATYDTLANKVVIAYQDEGNSDKGTFVTGIVSGTSISFGSVTIFNNALTDQPKAVFDSSANKVVIPYKDDGDGNKGKAVVVQVDSDTRGSTASGETAVIQPGGAINTLQTGLTAGQQYFVQTDGSLGETPANPSVIAGTAVSATDIIVKG